MTSLTSVRRRAARIVCAGVLAIALTIGIAMAPRAEAAAPPSAYGWGFNNSGQLGDGTTNSSATPVGVALPDGVTATAISAGASYSLALTSTGDIYGWGFSAFAGLNATPVQVPLPGGVAASGVSAGSGLSEGTYFNLALAANGTVYAWGGNGNGELGDGTNDPSATPVQVSLPAGVNAIAVAAGGDHGMALTSTGDIYAWGYNASGQLGDGDTNSSNVPVKVSLPAGVTATQISAAGDSSLALSSTGDVYGWGQAYAGLSGPIPNRIDLPAGVIATAVSTGRGGGVVLTSSGAVYELQGTTPVLVNLPSNVTMTAVAAGDSHNLALAGSGLVYAWGSNQYGQLGDGTNTDSAIPVLAHLPTGTRATAVSAGGKHSLAITVPAAGIPAQLAFAIQPSGGGSGTAFPTQPSVTVEDLDGNVVSTDTSRVGLDITPGTGASGAALTCDNKSVGATSGVASFTGCQIDKVGTGYTLHATDGTLTAADSAPFDITPGPPAKLAFVTQPSDGSSGSPFATQPAVAVEDAAGNVVTGDSSPVTLTISPGTGTAGANLSCASQTVGASSGVASFSGCQVDLAGTGYTLRATDGSLSTADSAPFAIGPGPPAQLAFTAQPSGGPAAAPFATQPAVAVEDAAGNVVSTDASQVTLSIVSASTPSPSLSCTANPLAASAGVASFSGCRVDLVGTGYGLRATDGSLTPASSATFDITPGTPAKLAFVGQPSGALSGTAFSAQPVVAVEDAGGNLVAGDNSQVRLSITPGTGSPGAGLTCDANPLAASSGTAAFSGCRIDLAGNGYALHATDGALNPADSARFSITSVIPNHGRSLVGVVTDQPPYAVGDRALTPTVPQAGKTVHFETHFRRQNNYSAQTTTGADGSYRFDKIPVACSSPHAPCYVWVTDSPGNRVQIQDSRRVSLGLDPSTTTQDLDWGHAIDFHAVTGTIAGPPGLPDPRIAISLTRPDGTSLGLAHTSAQQCTGPGCAGYDWRLESVQIRPNPKGPTPPPQDITIELFEGGIPIDSATMRIPVSSAFDVTDPVAVANADTSDITAPTLQGQLPAVAHGRSLVGVLTDHPPYAVGDRALTPSVPEAGKTVHFRAMFGGPKGNGDYNAQATTGPDGGYRFDNLPAGCSGSAPPCYVWVTDPASDAPIQDSRQVSLGPDPSTTVQNLDWGHATDYHAITGTVTGPAGLPDPRIVVNLTDRFGHVQALAQTGAQQCVGQGCSGYDWRLEHVQVDPSRTDVSGSHATVELTEGGVAVDSAEIPIPLKVRLNANDPVAVAKANTDDIVAPTLQGQLPAVAHGRSLVGVVTDQPPYAVGDHGLTPAVPEAGKTVHFEGIDRQGRRCVIQTTTGTDGSYRFDDLQRSCDTDRGYVWVTNPRSTTIQDSRAVSLGPDPSTTTQDLDWGHAIDYHAATGTIVGPAGLPDPRILIYLGTPNGPHPTLLAQTGAQQCAEQGCAGYDWRLESVQIRPNPKGPRAPTDVTVELTEGGVPIDSATMRIPLGNSFDITDPVAVAQANTDDLTAPTLHG